MSSHTMLNRQQLPSPADTSYLQNRKPVTPPVDEDLIDLDPDSASEIEKPVSACLLIIQPASKFDDPAT